MSTNPIDLLIIAFLVITSPFLFVMGMKYRMEIWNSLLNGDNYGVNSLSSNNIEEFSRKLNDPLFEELPSKKISIALSIPDSADIIVLMNFVTVFRNVFRCTPDGNIKWQSELPNNHDVYTNIVWEEGQLVAFGRSCIAVTIDVETGKILSPKRES
jgi:hypothetical protein